MIPYGSHFLDDDDIDAVVEVLRNGWLTQGPKVAEFEKLVASYTGANYAVAVSSGTAGLHLACLAAGVNEDSRVYTSANTFVATANAVLYAGGQPQFCDIDPDTLNMSIDCLEQKFASGEQINGVIPVHFAGLPCDMARIKSIADQYATFVIEDAAHAFGATYLDGSRVGNCKYSDMTVFSLHPVKGVTSGEGGLITTNDEALYRHLLSLRSHGICKGNFDFPGISKAGQGDLINLDDALVDGELNPWYYEMQELGFNYRITDFQCALATSQVKKAEKFLARRRELADLYDKLLQGAQAITVKQLGTRQQSSLHLYVIEIDFEALKMSKGAFMRELASKEIGTQVHYIPVPFQPYYADKGFHREDFPAAKHYYDRALSIPIYFGLSDEQVEFVVNEISSVVKAHLS